MWYLHLSGQIAGPFEENSFLALIKSNRIFGTDFVWTEGMSQWVRAMDISPWKQYFPMKPSVSVPTKHQEREEKKEPVAVVAPVQLLRKKRVSVDAYVVFEEEKYAVLNLSESGLIFEGEHITSVPGKEVSFKLVGPNFSEPFLMTGILVREDYNASQNLIAIEFTRLNPKYRKEIQQLVAKIAA